MNDDAKARRREAGIDDKAARAFAARRDEGPVTMLNLLKFAPGGAASYAAYGEAVRPLVEGIGGRVRFAGRPAECLIGEQDWDLMLLVEYPTRGAFLSMVASAEYRAIEHLRHQALERSVLYAVDPEST